MMAILVALSDSGAAGAVYKEVGADDTSVLSYSPYMKTTLTEEAGIANKLGHYHRSIAEHEETWIAVLWCWDACEQQVADGDGKACCYLRAQLYDVAAAAVAAGAVAAADDDDEGSHLHHLPMR